MRRMPFHIDGTKRTGRTEVFACAATDATLCVDNRNLDGGRIAAFGRHHLYRSRRAMAGAVAAFHAIDQRYAILSDPYGMADACR